MRIGLDGKFNFLGNPPHLPDHLEFMPFIREIPKKLAVLAMPKHRFVALPLERQGIHIPHKARKASSSRQQKKN